MQNEASYNQLYYREINCYDIFDHITLALNVYE